MTVKRIIRVQDLLGTVQKVESCLVMGLGCAPFETGSFRGGGEPPIILMGALIANAIFDATGVHWTHAPLTPVRLKAALGSS